MFGALPRVDLEDYHENFLGRLRPKHGLYRLPAE